LYACRIECAEQMKLAAVVGYDGPVKIWVDGREIFRDLTGTNPAVQDKARAAFEVEAGGHEVVVALSSNGGKAWGIFLRFERRDIPHRGENDHRHFCRAFVPPQHAE